MSGAQCWEKGFCSWREESAGSCGSQMTDGWTWCGPDFNRASLRSWQLPPSVSPFLLHRSPYPSISTTIWSAVRTASTPCLVGLERAQSSYHVWSKVTCGHGCPARRQSHIGLLAWSEMVSVTLSNVSVVKTHHKNNVLGPERWLSRLRYLLPSPRTWVQSSGHTHGERREPTPTSFLLTSTCLDTHTHTKC